MSSRELIKELFKAFPDARSLLHLFAFPFSLLSENGLTKNEEQIVALEGRTSFFPNSRLAITTVSKIVY
ncbi:hypothetical protein Y697_08535 [Mesotoga sp. BH458_6_3_2_1]|nr:hypothetical protein Y697_08535 [Mesotoga sp. BH458_6_3_2_1]